jgi:hypothetical protein
MAAAGDPNAYQVVVNTLAETNQEGVAFWCLDALIKQFWPMVQADAPQLIPTLLGQLIGPFAVVADRAAWALSIAGPVSVPALLNALHQASDPNQRVAYLMALRQNYHLPAHASAVLETFARLLQDPSAEVRYWAMVVTMNVSPLCPESSRPRLAAGIFEPLYHVVMPVAQEFINSRRDEFARRYHELIANHWLRIEERHSNS